MASNSPASFRVELSDIEDLQALAPAGQVAANGGSRAQAARRPNTRVTSIAEHLAGHSTLDASPFAALKTRQGRPLRVAILSDFVRIPYANGAVFQTRFLYQELRRCGHEVTVIGPHDPDARPDELAPGTISLPSAPLKTYPGVHVPLPFASWVFDPKRWNFDICFAQTTSLLMQFGVWLREMKGIPLLCVNTTHLTAAYDVLLPERLSRIEAIHTGLMMLKRPYEKLFSGVYNQSDGLVVLSEGLRTYWRERGVTVPIHVIPRAVQPQIFDKPLGPDPYAHLLHGDLRGPRLLCAGRHTREKAQDRAIRIFAKHILPHEPEATLTLLGDGPDRPYYERVAKEHGVSDKVFFPGEVPFSTMPDYYAYADLFVHTSLSETYGNVMGEALWCGTPTVAFADGMGVSAQIQDGVNGSLLAPGKGAASEALADAAFGKASLELLRNPQARAKLGKGASRVQRERCSPLAIDQKIADAFRGAQDHAAASGIRPAVERPKVMQWLTTFHNFRPWAAVNGGVYLAGHLRPAPPGIKRANHPQIAK
jgi:1,2-diacylglycerol 3-alpha-glucosyltransferase